KMLLIFFYKVEDEIRDRNVTGVQTCALPIYFFFWGHFDSFGLCVNNAIIFNMLPAHTERCYTKKLRQICFFQNNNIKITIINECAWGKFFKAADRISKIGRAHV